MPCYFAVVNNLFSFLHLDNLRHSLSRTWSGFTRMSFSGRAFLNGSPVQQRPSSFADCPSLSRSLTFSSPSTDLRSGWTHWYSRSDYLWTVSRCPTSPSSCTVSSFLAVDSKLLYEVSQLGTRLLMPGWCPHTRCCNCQNSEHFRGTWLCADWSALGLVYMCCVLSRGVQDFLQDLLQDSLAKNTLTLVHLEKA